MKKQLTKYTGIDYKDYNYGNPSEVAEELLTDLSKIEAILKNVDSKIENAGSFVAPGMKACLKADLLAIINSL